MEAVTAPVEMIVATKKRTRYNGRVKKRQWEEGGNREGKRACGEDGQPFERVKKKKMAVLMGYSGMEYFGMQRNPGVNTVEEEFCKALNRCNYVTDEAFQQMQTIDFQRAARTDKGVSAARQVVSVKLPEETEVEKINAELPDNIRVFGLKRVTKGFNSKTQCDARTYTYTLPTYSFERSIVTHESRRGYRVPQDKLDAVNAALSYYKGTKNYHNFTSKKEFLDPSTLRFMMSFQVDKVFVESDLEFAVLKVKGQSFMLHQIRKMVGLALAIVRGVTESEMMEKAFRQERVGLPTAPSLGLMLEQVHYDRYDTRYGKDGIHEPLDWSELNEIIEEFKFKHIYPNVIKTEVNEYSMAEWLETLDKHTFEPESDRRDKDETIQGNDETIQGNNETTRGKDEMIQGNNETIQVKDEIIQGDNETILGKCETIQGKDVTIQGKDESIQESSEMTSEENETVLDKNDTEAERKAGKTLRPSE